VEAKSARKITALGVLLCLRLQIGDMKRLSVKDGTRRWKSTRQRKRTMPHGADWRNRAVVSDKAQNVTVKTEYSCVVAIAKAGRSRRNLFEDTLRVGR
jgi:hypothetical protein